MLIVALLVLKSITQLSKRAARGTRTYRLGWFGEMLVGFRLKRLPDSFHVFYDVRLHEDAGNTDYVIVGPTGIYTIEVKNHTNHQERSRWHGKEKHQSKEEARQLHKDLASIGIDAGWIRSVLVRADLFWKKYEEQGAVTFVGVCGLNSYLEDVNPGVLTSEQVTSLATTIEQLAGCKTHAKSLPRIDHNINKSPLLAQQPVSIDISKEITP